MKVLFLDFDGVLNSHTWFLKRQKVTQMETEEQWIKNSFDPDAVKRLNKIIEMTGAKVVVSSSWRMARKLVQLREILGYHGFQGTIIDKTPVLHRTSKRLLPEEQPVQRGEEISIWLQQHKDVEKFAVVDDDSDMEGVRHVFVKTSFSDGLLDEHVEALVKLLS